MQWDTRSCPTIFAGCVRTKTTLGCGTNRFLCDEFALYGVVVLRSQLYKIGDVDFKQNLWRNFRGKRGRTIRSRARSICRHGRRTRCSRKHLIPYYRGNTSSGWRRQRRASARVLRRRNNGRARGSRGVAAPGPGRVQQLLTAARSRSPLVPLWDSAPSRTALSAPASRS